MLEICVSGLLVTSLAISLLLWQALVVAKQADDILQARDPASLLESGRADAPLARLMVSADD